MSESLASSISESMHHQSSWYTSVQAGQKVDFSDVRLPKCYPGFCDKSTVSPHIRSEMIVVQSFCQAEPIPDVPPDRSVQGSDVVDQFQQCRVTTKISLKIIVILTTHSSFNCHLTHGFYTYN